MKTIPKAIILLIIFINVFASVSEATQVSGDIWGIWDSSMNPIEVVGELRVPPDSSLFIGPGCYIEFQDYYALTLDTSAAFIKAIGAEQDSIIFTCASGRIWNGIDIYFADSTCVFAYCVMEKAHAPNIEDIIIGSGGAFHCEQSDLDIKNCRITNNRAQNAKGGGIYVDKGDIVLSNNIISGNYCAFGGAGIYFGIYVSSGSAVITDNVFEHDTASYSLGGQMSSAVECKNCSTLTFSRNIVRNNFSKQIAAVRLESSTATIKNNIVEDNFGEYGRSGFWITIEDSGIVASNVILRNRFLYTTNLSGGGMFLVGSNIRVVNNIIAFNEIWSYGGGIDLQGTNISLTNNIIAYNWTGDNAGGIYIDNSSYQSPNILKNNIIWGNVADNNPQIYNVANKPLEVGYCDVEGGWTGVGNIDIDPLFRDTANCDFHLMSTFCGDSYDSPCIDVGDPTIQDYFLDCDWGLGFLPSDMGAYGGGDTTLQAIEEYLPLIPEELSVSQNYPNPFNSSTTIGYFLNSGSDIRIEIYNILGQRVEMFCENLQQSGRHDFIWNSAIYPSGVYFTKVSSKNSSKLIRMVLLK
ncbi:MAG: T9SS type A sorting domain-containing protein [Candidatus Zixiibacteriota bacterium]|nr:MAG: T9SS type A sorting domain-containing protein [candidate division Zixibacteria bacterium]